MSGVGCRMDFVFWRKRRVFMIGVSCRVKWLELFSVMEGE